MADSIPTAFEVKDIDCGNQQSQNPIFERVQVFKRMLKFATSLLNLQAAVLQLPFQTAGEFIVSADWGH